ncbi:MAG: fused MFS/spermidine synthase [Planctomycetota bacterium]
MPLYGFTIFLGAFLLFQVQPLIARHILPWYGGGPGVWTACMLFFQVTLLAGYAYAHLVSGRLSVRRQVMVHAALMALSIPLVSIAPDAAWKPTGDEAPTLAILLLLGAHIGFPFAILSATSPLVTRWFSLLWPGRNPYRLYAISNAGSLLALLSYPFVVEPAMRLATQARLWNIAYAAFVLACTASAWRVRNAGAGEPVAAAPRTEGTGSTEGAARDPIPLWLALAATGSVLLIATTSRISQDVAVTPFLWVLPLSIYLVSFIIAFDHERWYRRGIFLPLLGVSCGAVAYVAAFNPEGVTHWWRIVLYCAALFAGTMVCHGELVRSKPAPERLTGFYLAVSAGGALGGVLVGVVAPHVFPDYWEYALGILAAGMLALYCVRRDQKNAPRTALTKVGWAASVGIILAVGAGLAYDSYRTLSNSIEMSRTFFGVVQIMNGGTTEGKTVYMRHGHIEHGSQFVEPRLRHIPTNYYGPESGVGVTLDRCRFHAARAGRKQLHIGIVGLGAGTLCTYGQPGDRIRIYEIDPEVERLARSHFTYLADCKSEVEVVIGDARIVLEREAAQGSQEFDVLVLDAFSSDAVPVHLLTREAMALYRGHMRPGGVIAIHVSNANVGVTAVARGMGEDAGLGLARIIATPDTRYDGASSDWVVATEDEAFLRDPYVRVAATDWTKFDREPIVWTDDFSSIWSAIPPGTEGGKFLSAPNSGRFVVDYAQVIEYEDRKRIQEVCRALYAQTGGANTIIAMTLVSEGSAAAPGKALEKLGEKIYKSIGLSRRKVDSGLLVLVSKKEQAINVQIGPDLPAELHQSISKILRATIGRGVRSGKISSSMRECVENLAALLVRSSKAAAAPG